MWPSTAMHTQAGKGVLFSMPVVHTPRQDNNNMTPYRCSFSQPSGPCSLHFFPSVNSSFYFIAQLVMSPCWVILHMRIFVVDELLHLAVMWGMGGCAIRSSQLATLKKHKDSSAAWVLRGVHARTHLGVGKECDWLACVIRYLKVKKMKFRNVPSPISLLQAQVSFQCCSDQGCHSPVLCCKGKSGSNLIGVFLLVWVLSK